MADHAQSVKLDESDYESIYLRVASRLIKLLVLVAVGLFSVVGAVFGVTSYYVAKDKIEAGVNAYLRSDEFRQNVRATYEAKLEELEKRAAAVEREISDKQRQAAGLAQGPVAIDQSGLVITNATGERFRIEMGKARSGESVVFKNAFKSPPVVVLTLDSDGLSGLERPITLRGEGVFGASGVSERGFWLGPRGQLYGKGFYWVALGS